MATTPVTNSPCYFLLYPSLRYITLGTANLPGSLTCQAILNRAGTQGYIIQATPSAQPGFSGSAIQGTYLATNRPGAGWVSSSGTTAASVGEGGFTFNGTTQFFEFDSLASVFSGVEAGITVTCVVQCNSGAAGPLVVWGLSSSTGTPALTLQYASGTLTLKNLTSGATTQASISGISTGLCVVSATRTSSAVSLRVWNNVAGTPTLQTASTNIATTANSTYTTFTVGAQANTSGTGANFFSGNIGKFGVFGVQTGTTIADVEELETEYLLTAGISRILDIADNTTAVGFEE